MSNTFSSFGANPIKPFGGDIGKNPAGSSSPSTVNSGKKHLFQIGFAALLARKQNPSKRYAFLKSGDNDMSFMFEPVLTDNTPSMDDNEYMKKKYYSWLVYEAAQKGQLDTSIKDASVDERAAKRFWAGRRGTGWKGTGKGGYMQSLDPGAAADGGYGTGYDSAAKEAENLMKTYMQYIYRSIELPLENMSKVASADLINTIGKAAVKQMKKGSYKDQVPPMSTFHDSGRFYVPPVDPPKDGTDEAIDMAVREYFKHFVSNPTMTRTSYNSVGPLHTSTIQQAHSKIMEADIMKAFEDGGLDSADVAMEKERYNAMITELKYNSNGKYLTRVSATKTTTVSGDKLIIKEYEPGSEPMKFVKFLDGDLKKNFPKFDASLGERGKGIKLTDEKKTIAYINKMRATLNAEIRNYQKDLSKQIWGTKKPYSAPMQTYKKIENKFFKELSVDIKHQMLNQYNSLIRLPKSQSKYGRTTNITKQPKYFQKGRQPSKYGTSSHTSYYNNLSSQLSRAESGDSAAYRDIMKRDWWVRDSKGMVSRLDLGAKAKERFRINNDFQHHLGRGNPSRNVAAGEIYDQVMAPFFAAQDNKHSESARSLDPKQRGFDLYLNHSLGTLRLRVSMFYVKGKGWAIGQNPGRGKPSSEGMWQVSIVPTILYGVEHDIKKTAFEYRKGTSTLARWQAVAKSTRDRGVTGKLNTTHINSSFTARANTLLGGAGPTQSVGAFVDSVVPVEMAERLQFLVNTAANNWFYGPGMSQVMDLHGLEGGDFKNWAMKWDKEARAFQKSTNEEFEADWSRWVMTIGGGATSQPPSVARAWHPPLFLGPFVHSMKYLGYGKKKWSQASAGFYENPQG